MAGESGSDAGELDLQNGVADSLDRVVELLKTMLDVAREYAMDLVSLVEQYLDWVRVVRERMLGEARDQRRRQAVDLLLSRVDRVELGRNLGAMTVAVAAPAGGNPTASAATLYLPRFNDPGLDRCFQGMMAGLLAPAEGVAGEPAQAGLL
jgi:hypothetical protein